MWEDKFTKFLQDRTQKERKKNGPAPRVMKSLSSSFILSKKKRRFWVQSFPQIMLKVYHGWFQTSKCWWDTSRICSQC